jgi:hypothetical protein
MVTCVVIWKCDTCYQEFETENEARECEAQGTPCVHLYHKGQLFQDGRWTTRILEHYYQKKTHEPWYLIELRKKKTRTTNDGIKRRVESGEWIPIY